MMRKPNLDMDTVVVKKAGIDITDIDGEKAMMDLDKGRYFILNEVGSSIWDIISEPCSVRDIVTQLIKEYEVDSVTCKQSTVKFLEGLNNAELITIK